MHSTTIQDARNFARDLHDLNFAISRNLHDLAASAPGSLRYQLLTVAFAAQLGADKAGLIEQELAA